jgi:glycosyltransferase involved in cell wall biosynthesis
MRVALISSGKEPLPVLKGGSVDTYAYYLSKCLSNLGIDVLLYANKRSKIKVNEKLKLKLIPYPNTIFEVYNRSLFDFYVMTSVIRERKNLDIIHTNLSSTTILLSKIFKNIVFTSHSAYWWRSESTHKLQIRAVKEAKAAIAISRFIEEKMKIYKKDNVFYIPNGVDINLFKPRKHEPKKILLTVCGISRQKGLIYLVKALKNVHKVHKDFRWIHIGPLPNSNNENYSYYLQLVKMIERYHLRENIVFLGRVSLEELIRNYQLADIFILPSLWEGMPLVVLEAMSCGLPIISTKISGVEDLITAKEGILVEPKNSKQLSNAIISLLEDEKLAKRLGKNARKRIENNFSWEIIASKIKKVYEIILKR